MTYREDVVQRITEITPAFCPEIYRDFVIRGEGVTKLEWNKTMLLDEGIDIIRLVFLKNQLENRVELTHQGITP